MLEMEMAINFLTNLRLWWELVTARGKIEGQFVTEVPGGLGADIVAILNDKATTFYVFEGGKVVFVDFRRLFVDFSSIFSEEIFAELKLGGRAARDDFPDNLELFPMLGT